MLSVKDIAWVAGILEGEGYFGIYKTVVKIQLYMTDYDIVRRVANLIGFNGSIVKSQRDGYKTAYYIQMTGDRAVQWMMTIYCLMGERRKTKIRSILDVWKHIALHPSVSNRCRRDHNLTLPGSSYIAKDGSRVCKHCRRLSNIRYQAKLSLIKSNTA